MPDDSVENYLDWKHEDLVEFVKHLEEEVQTLSKDNETLKRTAGRGGKRAGDAVDAEIAELNSEIEVLNKQQSQDAAEISQLKEKFAETQAKYKKLQDDKLVSDTRLKDYTKRVEALEKELTDVAKKTQDSDLQTKEAVRSKNANVKEIKRLLDENDSLREEIKSLRTEVDQCHEAIHALEDLSQKQAVYAEELELHKDAHDLAKDDLQNQINQLEHQLQLTSERLQISQDENNDLTSKLGGIQKELKAASEKAAADAKAAKDDILSLKREVANLKDTTQVGEKQKLLDMEKAEHKANLHLMDSLHAELEGAIHDRDQLAKRVVEHEEAMERLVAERVIDEREQNRKLQLSVQGLTEKVADYNQRMHDLEEDRRTMARTIDDLTNWKSIYESGHGLQELARNQKKLKDDNRRLGVAVEQMTAKLGAVMDMNGILSQAFDRLKRETGMKPNFMYPEYELHQEMMGDNARLKAQTLELEGQIGSLEAENIRIRKALKNQAGVVGEHGFKYAGMTADQLVRVNEYAASLREGADSIPEEARPHELIKENRSLREDLKVANLQIERYERELGGAVASGIQQSPATTNYQTELTADIIKAAAGEGGAFAFGGGLNKEQEGDLYALREDVHTLLGENSELSKCVSLMQSELVLLIGQKSRGAGSDGNGDNQELVSILMANNEELMKELHALKQSAFASQHSASRASSVRGSQSDKTLLPLRIKPGMTSSPIGKTSVSFTPWTPMGRSGLGLGAGLGVFGPTPTYSSSKYPSSSYSSAAPFTGPVTPHGQQLLTRSLAQLNLPPEEWAEEVRELNGQLVECLERLYEREREVEEQQGVIQSLEDTLVGIKQQMATLYYDFAHRCEQWEQKEKQFKQEATALNHERDDLKLRLKNLKEVANVIQKEGKEGVEAADAKLIELSRKVIVYEVNELVLSRKFILQSEHLADERSRREQIERDFVEMENTLKKRILFLEQYKASASSRVGYLQGRCDLSVPQEDYLSLQAELEHLREDHLAALRREVEARLAALKTHDQGRELRALKVVIAHLESDALSSRTALSDLVLQLDHQKDATQRALKAANASAEISSIVTEMAKFRGEASRFEVEMLASNRRAELLSEQLQAVSKEADELSQRMHELEAREDEAAKRETEARKVALELKLEYEGGLTRDDASALKETLQKCQKSLEDAQRDAEKYKELSEIASLQAETIGAFRKQYEEELRELREHCAKMESRGDDELLIGKLQRQLMTTKSSYRAFTRKYQLLRGNMQQRELALRVLETRLDQREYAVLELQDSHRLEVAALKKALRVVNNLTIDNSIGFGTYSNASGKGGGLSKSGEGKSAKVYREGALSGVQFVGDKLVLISNKVQKLAEMAGTAMTKASDSEASAREYQGVVEDLEAEKDILLQRCRDLEVLSKHNGAKQGAIAARLVSLSEDLRVNKLSALQQKRKMQALVDERKHLQRVIAGMEVDVEDLEHGKVLAETRNLLGGMHDIADGASGDGGKKNGLSVSADAMVNEYKRLRGSLLAVSENEISTDDKQGVQLITNGVQFADENNRTTHNQKGVEAMLTPDDYIIKLESLSGQLSQSRKEASGNRLQLDKLSAQVSQLEKTLQERNVALRYCEKVFAQEGLPSFPGFGASGLDPDLLVYSGGSKYAQRSGGVASTFMREEQDQMQAAATATISSLRSLLDEKNRMLEKLQQKVEDLQRDKKVKSVADRKADALLQELDSPVLKGRPLSSVYITDNSDPSGMQARLLEQIEKAEEIMRDKDRTVSELEQKLLVQSNQRERAEARCGSALSEMEAMKADMVTLVSQVRELEQRKPHPHPPKPNTQVVAPSGKGDADSDRHVAELKKKIKAKDEKIVGYRQIIVKLKDEFLRSEEEHARSAKTSAKDDSPRYAAPAPAMNADELRELRSQVSALRDGLRQAKDDMEKAKSSREKLLIAKRAALEEAEKMDSQLRKAEAQAIASQESLLRVRKELEDSRRKEIRLRNKLKELLEKDGQGPESDMQATSKEIEVLRAQNLALRIAVENNSSGAGIGTFSSGTGIPSKNKDTHGPGPGSSASRGRVLGAEDGNVDGAWPPFDDEGVGAVGDYRQQMKAKWENEKRLQKRVSVLEKRLQEKLDENAELQIVLKKTRDTAQGAMSKDDMQKKAAAAVKLTQEARKLTLEDLAAVEEAHERVFMLEQDNSALKKKVEVDLPSEIMTLRHQLSASRTREQELKSEVEYLISQLEGQSKRAAIDGSSGRSLRESEDRFMRDERLRDDLERARRQRLELEAALLDRDTRAVESRFDLEARMEEVARLKRRLHEVEMAYRTAVAIGPPAANTRAAPMNAWAADSQATGSASSRGGQSGSAPLHSASPGSGVGGLICSSKRELELEGVVEAMKRVVEKLKGENERLRRGGVAEDDRKAADLEKRALSEKKRAEKLESDLKALQEKVRAADDSGQKLVQRQQQITILRRQVKAKEDEAAALQQQVDALTAEKETMGKKAAAAEAKAGQLELNLQQAARFPGDSDAPGRARGTGASGLSGKGKEKELEREVAELKKQATSLGVQNETLKSQLVEAKLLAAGVAPSGSAVRDRATTGGGDSSSRFGGDAANEVRRLREENDKLKRELSAFDLDFFEEIENLKYAHAEAVRRLRMYESSSAGSPARRMF